ncbi:GntR family transcriptional regulator [Pseudonocardia sulfidoxydans NBRC 16205]|uniref:GntR family transcriptional regulator n=1 Tax=Pseudonocardia sulfidoxydans NBRC 16205 TaxID=1223511 RepID=A0A511DG47_9PSEU|nr:FCD domain-containing protein [Pseudonocardia sulfidoxydans]GEL23759.1 GntR family transcriptional regulator [Pseudonocardia sulfidoxydans NBRC 16205]
MRTHQVVLAHIEEDLASGRIRVGDRLPGERALAEQLGVSRPSVREAIKILEALGVIRTATGSGPEAGATVVADPAAGLGAALRLHVATDHVPVRDVVDLRLLVEGAAVRDAAARPTTDGLDQASALLDAMDVPGLDAPRFLDLDGAFHVTLAGMSGNVLHAAVLAGIGGAVREYIGEGAARAADWPTLAGRLRAEHRAILHAVRDGRADDAEAMVRRHIEDFHRDTASDQR